MTNFEYLERAHKLGVIRIYDEHDNLVYFTNTWSTIAEILKTIDASTKDPSLPLKENK